VALANTQIAVKAYENFNNFILCFIVLFWF